MTDLLNRIESIEKDIAEKRKNLLELKRSIPPVKVQNYEFRANNDRSVKLSKLFLGHSELMIIHNMGKGCPYCTLWADGLNGMIHHLENRTGLALISPDDPAIQREFASGRGWRFSIISGTGSSFSKDMGFEKSDGEYMPGVLTFKKDSAGKLYRTGMDFFGPHDNYCALWHLFDLLPDGINNWEPKFSY